ncbi:uncharacterized protein LOC131842015 [Achroia grisella]|uniref:uncharacterized protein LOC131842015 n=1 Tax=Achroia grisella TaxID=688607 RepID=UPI0027D2F8D8|nr:uncharacterized protein LOC131842015 [Achroia grisella]
MILVVVKTSFIKGKFGIAVTKFELCKGPKIKDCCTWKYRIENENVMTFEAEMTENMPSVKGKILVSTNGKESFRLQMNRLCDHLFVGPLVKTFLNFTNNCIILKGHYDFTVDVEKAAQNYYGGSFIYGNLTFKAAFNNNQCNLFCGVFVLNFYPKNATNS